MKKVMGLMVVAALAAALLLGCAPAPAEAEASAEVPNPMVEAGSLEELGQAVGFDPLAYETAPEGYTETTYFAIADTVAEVRYTDPETGEQVTVRTSKGTEPNHGMYFEELEGSDPAENIAYGFAISMSQTPTGGWYGWWVDERDAGNEMSYSMVHSAPEDEAVFAEQISELAGQLVPEGVS